MTTRAIHVQGLEKTGSPALRASDADRDRIIELLRAAVADGRLDPVEFDERLDAPVSAIFRWHPFFGVINVDVEAKPAKLTPADGGRCGPRKSWG
ncbi:DUF1707 SHOCT-like domain-containing protein [Nonomuraea turcica]|uniref:DUF1707 SHOCT-like domain-containing protein n=1 Tax=Nonomuraea sp. G32 TaxID=3067274 RepID=UPI00353047F7